MAEKKENYGVTWSKTGKKREIKVDLGSKKMVIQTDEDAEEVFVNVDGTQATIRTGTKLKDIKIPGLVILPTFDFGNDQILAAGKFPADTAIFTHNSPVCVDIPTRRGIIHL
jgi:hypothetical protein